MFEHYLWLTPMAALGVLLLFRFVGCSTFGSSSSAPGDTRNHDFTFGDSYATEVMKDNPVGYWRLQGVGLVGHAAAASNGAATPATTNPPIDTSGATLLVVAIADFSHNSTVDTLTDTFGNSWHPLNNATGPSVQTNLAIWYAWDHGGVPLVTGPGHSVTGIGDSCSLEFTAWSGIQSDSDPFEGQQNTGAAHNALSAQPGSITPSVDGALVITAAGFSLSGAYSVDSGYTVSDQMNHTTKNIGTALAFLVQGSAAATNPTWKTNGAAADISCAIASFRAAPNSRNDRAKNEVAGKAEGQFLMVSTPLSAGDPAWLSVPVSSAVLDHGVTDPDFINHVDTTVTACRLNGGYVQIPCGADLNAIGTEFTLEALVFPEWADLTDGKFRCLLEFSGPVPGAQKNTGFAVYAGPGPGGPQATWQLWVGTGSEFKPMTLKNPPAPPDKTTEVVKQATYLAVVYRNGEYYFYVYYHPGRELDDKIRYELNPETYQPGPVSENLFIGISGPQRALFAPFPGPNPPNGFLYPFEGRVAEVAIYNIGLAMERIASHANAAFK